ncbi:acyltransferase family protein [Bradyrhizobium sp. HKCCYLS1011]|uniref:acyltransferase family protein n=1 Tax=Bradyrhizobium sp. HKCCYLS1011 TaxID=3420733 RepID=UPI003EBE6274
MNTRSSELAVEGELPPLVAHVGGESGARSALKAGAKERNGGIDALRAAVTLLVVLHHTAITYGAIGGWYYKEIAPSDTPGSLLLVLFCTVNQAWFMGLFFLLAGYYTPPSFRRHGAAGFVRERLIRLGIPLAVYFFVLSPLTKALAQTANGRSFPRVFEYVWAHGQLEPGPLWFAQALLIFALAWLLWQWVRPPALAMETRAFPSNKMLLAAALFTGVAAFLLRLVWPVGVNVAFLQLGYFASYIVLFAAGCAEADGRWLEHIPDAQRKTWLRMARIALPIFPLAGYVALRFHLLTGPAEGGLNPQAVLYAFWEPFVAWGFILGLLALFQRRFAQLSGPWKHLARRAYLIYIIHPPILVGVALAWRDIAAPALVKFVVTGTITCALCYLVAGVLLRAPPVARVV